MIGPTPENNSAPDDTGVPGPWYRQLNRYHWFVLSVAALGWLFDCLDQQLFILARPAAMKELVVIPPGTDAKAAALLVSNAGNLATSIFIAGWATGGLIFGMLGDRIGRAKTMVITILMYSLFTGLSSFSTGFWDFSFYRFLTGLGVGGEFAVGVALVAEVMPNRARSGALALLQALSAFGNVSAALINLGLGVAEEHGLPYSPWRIMFIIGAVPALLALVVRYKLKEPEKWQKASHEGVAKKQLGSYRALFRNPVLRKHALLGLVLGCSGIIGLWSVGFFTPDLIRAVQRKAVTQEVYEEALKSDPSAAVHIASIQGANADPALAPSLDAEAVELKAKTDKAINGRLSALSSYVSIAINAGAFLGMFGFGALAAKFGRKPTFALAFVAAFVSTVSVFWFLQDFWQIWVMVPVMGFCQLSLFAGYAIYFPELFPTHLRSTGISFCYNVGRFVAAFGPLVKSGLENLFHDTAEPLRYAGMTMCFVFLVGLLVLPFLPETRGKPLPE